MRRTVRLLALPAGLVFLLAACGSPPDDNVAPKPPLTSLTAGGTPRVVALYDPTREIMPLPNDLVWLADGDPQVELEVEADDSDEMAQLKQLVTSLDLLGFSPNMFLTVPVSGAVDTSSLEVIVFRLDGSEMPRTVAGFEVLQGDGVVKLMPKQPFTPGAYYAVAVKSTLRDADGYEVEPSPVMNALKSTEPITDTAFAALEDLRAGFNAPGGLFDGLAQATQSVFGQAWDRGDTLLLWTFHTADKTLSLTPTDPEGATLAYADFDQRLQQFKALSSLQWTTEANALTWLDATGQPSATPVGLPASAVLEPEGIPYDALGMIYSGFYRSPDLSGAEAQGVTVPFILAVPASGLPCPVVVFQHGLNRDKSDAMALANALAKAGVATLAIDAPYHGDRTPEGYESGELFFTTNMIQDRFNIYQAAVDLWEAFDLVEAGAFDTDQDEAPDFTLPAGFVAHSLGSIIGSTFLAADDRPERILLSSASGQLAAVLDQSHLENLAALVSSLGYQKGTTAYYVFLNLVQWLMDPVDGMYTGIGQNSVDELLAVFAYQDPVVSYTTNRLFLAPLGLDGSVTVVDPTAIDPYDPDTYPAPVPGAYQYGTEGHPVIHSFLLTPLFDADFYGDAYLQDDQTAAYAGAQGQAAGFFADLWAGD